MIIKWVKQLGIISLFSGLISPTFASSQPVTLIYKQAPSYTCSDTTSETYTTAPLDIEPQQCVLQQVSLTNNSGNTIQQITLVIPIDPSLKLMRFKQGQAFQVASGDKTLRYEINNLTPTALTLTIVSLAAKQSVDVYVKVKVN